MPKRIFDLFSATFGILILLPVFAVIAMLIKLDSSGPVFFRQFRVGRFAKPFKIHKFRTMTVDTEREGRLTVGNDIRVTRVGAVLRKLKLDELPQLIDVIKGDMSLVGPRPEVQEFMDAYPVEIRQKVLSVRPGITDLASIEMVDENLLLAKFEDPKVGYIEEVLPIKQRYYIDYVDQNSLMGDLRIILLTIKKIVTRR